MVQVPIPLKWPLALLCALWSLTPSFAAPTPWLCPDILGANESCVNQLETYSVASPMSGYTYTWSASPGGIPSGTSGTGISVSWTTAGAQWVVLQSTPPGGSPMPPCTLSVTIHPRPTPVILSDFISDCDERVSMEQPKMVVPSEKDPCWVVCEYMTINYETEYVPGNTYQWIVVGGTPTTASGPSINVTWGPAGSGFIILTETAPGGCSETVQQCVDIVESPEAWFTFNGQNPNTLEVCLNQAVYFTDQSVGASSWYWEFGDGATSILQNPVHTYPGPGVYYGTLTVTNECGCTSSIDFRIKVTPEVSPIIGCISTVCLKDCAFYSVTNICDGANVTWSINGGQIINQPSPGSVNVVWDDVDGFVTGNGYGEICVRVTGCPDLCDGEVCVRVPVIHQAAISGETVVCVGDPVTYSVPVQPGINEPGLSPPNGIDFQWSVSGGGIIISPQSYSNTITVQWLSPGTHTVNLAGYENPLTDGDCRFAPDPLTVTVKPKFSINPPTAIICLGDSQTFTPNPPDDFSWTVTGVGGTTGPVPVSNPGAYTVAPTATGVYAVSAQSNSGAYCNITPSAVLQVVEAPAVPSGSLVGETVVCLNMPYTYTYNATPPPGTVFVWDINGGNLYNDLGPTATATWTGGTMELSVRLRTTEAPFCESAPVTFTISEYTPPANFVGGPTNVCVDENHGYSISGLSNYTSLQWSVNPPNSGSVVTGQGTPNITVQFTNTPNPPVSVECTAMVCGVALTDVLPVTVTTIPNYAISAPSVVCQGDLTGLSVTPTTGIASYAWDFGDNSSGSSSPTPNHAWAAPGTYLVTALLTLNICGNPVVTVTTTIDVNPKPEAYMTATNGFVLCAPSTTLTVATQIFCNYTWSTGATGPTLTVTTPGTYAVTATDPVTGCSTVITKVVSPCPPPACVSAATPWNFTFSENCDTYTFVPVSSANSNYIGWNFGDLTGSNTSGNQTHTYAHPGYYQVTIFSYDPVAQCTLAIVQTITVKFKGKFTANFDCSSGSMLTTLTDISEYLPGFPAGTPQWFDGGTLIGTGSSLTVNLGSGPHNIHLQVTVAGQTCSSPTVSVDVPGLPAASFTHNAPICEGFPVSFTNTSSGGINYAWTFGDGSGSGLFSPDRSYSADGTYPVTLTVNSAWGCSANTSASVQILPAATPFDISIAPISPVCAGTPVVLTASTLPAPATYTWFNVANAGTPLQGPAPGNTFTTGLSGLYGVSATDGNGCQYNALANDPVVVTPAPYIHFTGKTDYCLFQGNMVVSADIGPNYSYSWTVTQPWGASSPAGTDPTAVWNTFGVGTYTFFVTITDNNTGCSSTGSTTTTVHPGPSPVYISADDSCAPTMLTANGAVGATQFNWNTGATGSNINVVQGGYYSVIATDNWGCTVSDNFYLLDRPDLSNVMTGCYDFCERVYWQAPNCFGCTYQWTLNGSPIPGETNSTILIGNSGVYTVIVGYGNPQECTTESGPIDISISTPDMCKKCKVEVRGIKLECIGTDPQTGQPIYSFEMSVVNFGSALYGLTVLSDFGPVTLTSPGTGFLPGGGAHSILQGQFVWNGNSSYGCIRFYGFLTSDCKESDKCEFKWCGELPKCCDKCDIDIVDRRVECIAKGYYRVSLTIKNSGCALVNLFLKTPYTLYPLSPSTLQPGTLTTVTAIITGNPGTTMDVYVCGTLPNGEKCCRGVQIFLPECPPVDCKLDEGRNGITCIGYTPDGHPIYQFSVEMIGVPPGSTIHVLPSQAGLVTGVTANCVGSTCVVQGTYVDYSNSGTICFYVISITNDEIPRVCEGKFCLATPPCPENSKPASGRQGDQAHAAKATTDRAYTLMPNPATHTVRIAGTDTSTEAVLEVRVADMVGKYNSLFRVAGNNPVLDIAQLPAGVYIVTISDGKGLPVSKKLTVLK